MWRSAGVTGLLLSASLLTGCATWKRPVPRSAPPPPAAATLPCRTVILPLPLTDKALARWILEDARADADCESKRRALVEAWPRER